MILPSRGLLPLALLTLASIGQGFLKYGLQTIRIDTGPVTEAQDEIFGTRFDVPLYLYARDPPTGAQADGARTVGTTNDTSAMTLFFSSPYSHRALQAFIGGLLYSLEIDHPDEEIAMSRHEFSQGFGFANRTNRIITRQGSEVVLFNCPNDDEEGILMSATPESPPSSFGPACVELRLLQVFARRG